MKQALFFNTLSKNKVECLLCPHNCIIQSDSTGICKVRKNSKGILYTLNYEESANFPTSDPIEKKPLYHFHPGKDIISLGPNSCNLQCQFCQNWNISQEKVKTYHITSDELIKIASENSIGIAYTYTEPFTWYEFILETAPKAKEQGLKNVLVTNGFINEEPLIKLLPYIDALNIDVKSADEDFYRKICKGKLDPVLKACELAKKYSWIEITNLVIPTLNDDNKNIIKLVDWISKNLGKETPVHFSKYFPQYKMNISPTTEDILINSKNIADEFLYYVYLGNISIVDSGNTYCPGCKNLLIERLGYNIKILGIKDSLCSNCSRKVDIIGI